MLDIARLLAALGVVWIHACQHPAMVSQAAWGRFAVPFFAATAAYLAVGSLLKCDQLGWREFATSRLTRLYIPFIIWSGIYLTFKLVKAICLPTAENQFPGWELLLFGGAYHLWFIPFLLFASLWLFWLVNAFGRSASASRQAATTCFAAGLLLATSFSRSPLPENEWGFMALALPALLWGAALGWLRLNPVATTKWLASLAFCCFVICQFSIPAHVRAPIMENAAGMSLLMAALYLPPWQRLQSLARWGQFSLGLYFSHLLFIKVGEVLLDRVDLTGPLTSSVLLMLAASLAGLACSWLLSQSKLTRRLVA